MDAASQKVVEAFCRPQVLLQDSYTPAFMCAVIPLMNDCCKTIYSLETRFYAEYDKSDTDWEGLLIDVADLVSNHGKRLSF